MTAYEVEIHLMKFGTNKKVNECCSVVVLRRCILLYFCLKLLFSRVLTLVEKIFIEL